MKKLFAGLSVTCLSTLISVALATEKDAEIEKTSNIQPHEYRLMLVGGGLSTCSSLAPRNCRDADFTDDTRQNRYYRVDEKNVNSIMESNAFLQLDDGVQEKARALFLDIYANYQNETIDQGDLKRAFESADVDNFDGGDFYQTMSDAMYYTVLDYLEAPSTNDRGERQREMVDLSQNDNRFAKHIYEQFVAMAAGRLPEDATNKPTVAVVTASSRDPFESADFYASAFEMAGAEVVWLPLDQTYQYAREQEVAGFNACNKLPTLRAQHGSFNREAIYPERTAQQLDYCQNPEKMLDALSKVQGIFFNGGDQSLTRKALRWQDGSDSPELQLIKQRFNNNELVVGGTSAGTAVQPGGQFEQRPLPMISNGDSSTAFQRGAFAVYPPSQRCQPETPCDSGLLASDLTYEADGGSGLFQLGTLDTHFSERDREARLAMLAAYTGTRYAFGVDEATALLVGSQDAEQTPMAVIGEGGVWVVDTRSGIYKVQNDRRQLVAMSHYLNHGDGMSYNAAEQRLEFNLRGTFAREITRVVPPVEDGEWRQQVFKRCGTQEPVKWAKDNIAFVAAPTEDTRFYVTEDDIERCSYINLSFGMEN